MTPYSSRRVFTLIELLVVIAIISILASLLLPALGKARAAAKAATCQSQIKNQALAITLYADDNDGFIPSSYGGTSYDLGMASPGGWSTAKVPAGLGYLLYDGYISDYKLYYCPAVGSDVYYKMSATRTLDKKTTDGFRAAIDSGASGSIGFFFTYAYRGQFYKNDNNGGPAHGPADTSNQNYVPYLNHLTNRPCSTATCGGYHETLAIISDDFTYKLGDWSGQGRQHHDAGFSVGYTDGHVNFLRDGRRQVVDYDLRGIVTSLYIMNKYSEDIWDAFDGDIGIQYAGLDFAKGLK